MTALEREVMSSLACICAQVLYFMRDEADEYLSLSGVQWRIDQAVECLALDTNEPVQQVRAEIYDFEGGEDD